MDSTRHHRGRRFVAGLWLTLACGTAPLALAQGDSSRQRVITIEPAAQRTVAPATPATTAAPAPRQTYAGRPIAELQPKVRRLVNDSVEFQQHSSDSFRRGLLPLQDHLEHLMAQRQVGVLQAAINDRPPLEAARQFRDHLATVEVELRSFRQIASAGWAADVVLSRLMLAEADLEVARISGNRALENDAIARRATLAREHWELREWDAHMGLATLQDLSYALGQVSAAGVVLPDQSYGQFLDKVSWITARWEREDSGIGRADRRALSDFQLSAVNLNQQLQSENWNQALQVAQTADRAAGQMFAKTLEFHRHGTAGLGDLSRAWTLQHQVRDTVDSHPQLRGKLSREPLQSNLRQLTEVASQTRDERGRHAADVRYVRMLNGVQQLGLDPWAESN